MAEWQPESEKSEEIIGRAIMRREELRNMAMSLALGNLRASVENPITTAWESAVMLQESLDKQAPIPAMGDE